MPALWTENDVACGSHALLLLVLLLVLTSAAGCALPGPSIDLGPTFYPEPPEEPRIQYLATYSSDKDLVGEMNAFQRFIFGTRRYFAIHKPYGVALEGGKLFTCDTAREMVVVFDLKGGGVELIGNGPSGRLATPINIAIDSEGTRYVADTGRRRVMVYDAQNRYVTAFGTPESWSPSDVVVFEDRLYVADVENGQIVVLDRRDGEELERFGELFFPTNLEVDADENLYVADTGNARIVKYDHRGKLVQEFGTRGLGFGKFVRPKGVAVDRDGRLYVVDAAFQNVQIFDPDGELLLFFGSVGDFPGGLFLPAKVEIDYDHVELFADRVAPGYVAEYLILVTNQLGPRKVNVYGFLKESKRAEGRAETSR